MKINKGKYTVNCSQCNAVLGFSPHDTSRIVMRCFDCDRFGGPTKVIE